MKTEYYTYYSNNLNRTMECKVYGHAGTPVLFLPCQDGRFFDFENFHMTDIWAPWIERGRVQVFCVDTIDKETWSSQSWDKHARIVRHEAWISYLVYEALPFFRTMTESTEKFMLFGCSMGAMHAANLYFRFPDLFGSILALSGLYDSRDSFGDYMDELVYQNSPVDYLRNMPNDHPYLAKYNAGKMIFCVGQGAWETVTKPSTMDLERVCKEKGIHAWVDYWGYDCAHDWSWWYRQVQYFLPKLLDE